MTLFFLGAGRWDMIRIISIITPHPSASSAAPGEPRVVS